ncbi:TPA: HeH/LEM domain-containing protein, partial [Enterococcus hirae]
VTPSTDGDSEQISHNSRDKSNLTDKNDFTSLRVSELKHLLDEKNISYKSSDKREDLIALLEESKEE